MSLHARLIALVSLALSAGCKPVAGELRPVASCTGPEYLEVVAETIVTMDPDHPKAQRLLIAGGEIVAVDGEGQAASELGEACVTTVELGDATLIPGVIDSHTHVRELGMDALEVELVGAQDLDTIVARLVAAHPDPSPDTWILGQGWDEGAFASAGYPDAAAALSAAFPRNPVALASLHGFAAMYNDAALAIAGVGSETAAPAGGTILRRADGAPTGVLLASAQALVDRHIPPPSLDQRKRAITSALETLARAGVTAVHEAGMGREDVEAFVSLADAGALPIRVYGMLTGNDAALMDAWFARGPLDHLSGMLEIRAIKVFYDGSLGSRTAVLAGPYADAPELAAPAERISPAQIEALGRRAATTGFQLATHAIGDEGNRRVLAAYAAALDEHPGLDHRWRIEHAQVVGPAFFADAAALGVIASMQPSHAVGDSAWAEDRLGPERIGRAYAWRSMLDAGIPLIFNSDLPGEPWTPMQTLYFAVTRAHLDGEPAGGWQLEQAVEAEEALRAMTATAAYASFAEDRLGVLKVGARADFVVLDANPLAVEAATIADVGVRATWVEGREVWPAVAPGV